MQQYVVNLSAVDLDRHRPQAPVAKDGIIRMLKQAIAEKQAKVFGGGRREQVAEWLRGQGVDGVEVVSEMSPEMVDVWSDCQIEFDPETSELYVTKKSEDGSFCRVKYSPVQVEIAKQFGNEPETIYQQAYNDLVEFADESLDEKRLELESLEEEYKKFIKEVPLNPSEEAKENREANRQSLAGKIVALRKAVGEADATQKTAEAKNAMFDKLVNEVEDATYETLVTAMRAAEKDKAAKPDGLVTATRNAATYLKVARELKESNLALLGMEAIAKKSEKAAINGLKESIQEAKEEAAKGKVVPSVLETIAKTAALSAKFDKNKMTFEAQLDAEEFAALPDDWARAMALASNKVQPDVVAAGITLDGEKLDANTFIGEKLDANTFINRVISKEYPLQIQQQAIGKVLGDPLKMSFVAHQFDQLKDKANGVGPEGQKVLVAKVLRGEDVGAAIDRYQKLYKETGIRAPVGAKGTSRAPVATPDSITAELGKPMMKTMFGEAAGTPETEKALGQIEGEIKAARSSIADRIARLDARIAEMKPDDVAKIEAEVATAKKRIGELRETERKLAANIYHGTPNVPAQKRKRQNTIELDKTRKEILSITEGLRNADPAVKRIIERKQLEEKAERVGRISQQQLAYEAGRRIEKERKMIAALALGVGEEKAKELASTWSLEQLTAGSKKPSLAKAVLERQIFAANIDDPAKGSLLNEMNAVPMDELAPKKYELIKEKLDGIVAKAQSGKNKVAESQAKDGPPEA